MTKLLSAVFALFALLLSLNIFAAEGKSLKIAVDTTYPPMEFESVDGKIIGLDVDLAKAMAKAMGRTPEFVVMPWD